MKKKTIKCLVVAGSLAILASASVIAAAYSGYTKAVDAVEEKVEEEVEEKMDMVQPIQKEEIQTLENENISEEIVSNLKEKWTVALFGIDSRDMENIESSNSDVIILASVNNETGEIKLVSVYRDTCLKTGENRYKKVNEAYSRGGPKKALEVLNENLDLQIDDYVAVNWAAVATGINILGGIDVEIEADELKYLNNYITETVNSTGIGSVQIEEPGLNHLDGVQAVAYSRIRHTDNDFKRTERQRLVISRVLEKAKESDIQTLAKVLNTVLPMVASSVDMDDFRAVSANALKYHISETTGFPFEHKEKRVERLDYVFPDDLTANVSELHRFLYGTENYEPSDTVKEISEAVRKKGGFAKKSSEGEAAKATETVKEKETVSLATPATAVSVQESEEETSTAESEYVQEPAQSSEEAEKMPDSTGP